MKLINVIKLKTEADIMSVSPSLNVSTSLCSKEWPTLETSRVDVSGVA